MGNISSLFNLNRFPNHLNIVRTALSCITVFLHQRGTSPLIHVTTNETEGAVKKKVTESHIEVLDQVLRIHNDNVGIMSSGFVVLLQLAKLRTLLRNT